MINIPTRIHGILDYGVALFFIAAPRIFKLTGYAANVFVISGIATIIYSLLTRYEMGIAHIIPMKKHLNLDLASGIIVAASPWIFGFSKIIFLPHLVFGLMEILVVIFSSPVPNIGENIRQQNIAE
jgi:hypothetical protein